MNEKEFNALTAKGEYIEGGSEAHVFMGEAAEEARRITSEMNSAFRTAKELRELFSRLTGRDPATSSGFFRPFTPITVKT